MTEINLSSLIHTIKDTDFSFLVDLTDTPCFDNIAGGVKMETIDLYGLLTLEDIKLFKEHKKQGLKFPLRLTEGELGRGQYFVDNLQVLKEYKSKLHINSIIVQCKIDISNVVCVQDKDIQDKLKVVITDLLRDNVKLTDNILFNTFYNLSKTKYKILKVIYPYGKVHTNSTIYKIYSLYCVRDANLIMQYRRITDSQK